MEKLLITGLGKQDVIFGLPWFKEYNPNINWTTGRMTFSAKPSKFALQYIRKDTQRQREIRNAKTTTIRHMEQEEERQEEAQKEWKCIRQEMDNTMDQIQRKIKEQPRPSDSPNWRKKEENTENKESIIEVSSLSTQDIQEEENNI